MSASAVKARKLSEAHEKAKGRVETLASQAAALAESFDDPGDAGKVISARRAVEDAKAERDLLAVALAKAEKDHAAAVAEEATRTEDERCSRTRKELGSLAVSLTSDLVTFGKKLAAHEALANSLPGDRFKFWPASYAETASRSICTAADMARPGGVAQVDLRLLIPTRP